MKRLHFCEPLFTFGLHVCFFLSGSKGHHPAVIELYNTGFSLTQLNEVPLWHPKHSLINFVSLENGKCETKRSLLSKKGKRAIFYYENYKKVNTGCAAHIRSSNNCNRENLSNQEVQLTLILH